MKVVLCVLALLATAVGGLEVFRIAVKPAESGHEVSGPVHRIQAPEIDPAACIGALGLLAIGTLILTDRRRYEQAS
jgi:hypothetical protein